jgi:Zn-dependent peptidase ImmA (M78 family)
LESFIATPLSIRDIRAKAFALRKSLDLDNSPYFPIVEFVELILPQIIPEFEFHIGTEKETGDCHGLTYPEENCIKIREDVYINATNGKGRDRFTIAHELGHYILHKSQNIALARTTSRRIEAYKNPEWQANTFAAELLMPVNLINPSDTVLYISDNFGVSFQAAKVRINKIK